MDPRDQDIKCSIFCDVAAVIKKTAAKVKETRISKEKQYYAQDILLEAKALFSCSNHYFANSDCVNCRSISRQYIREYEYLAGDGRK